MSLYTESNPKIQIQMFGEFSITINGHTLTNLKGRTKRVWMLIQYLVVHRGSPVPLDRLLRDLWDGRECGDPENALKNLVYRARALLRDLSGTPSPFIMFLNGTYAWNNQYPCEIDSERFLENAKKAFRETATEEDRVRWYRKALELYSDGFLPKSAYSTWVILQRARYAEYYYKCVAGICAILTRRGRYVEVIPVCESALRLFPFEESIHALLLQAYSSLGLKSKAFDHYNRTVKLFDQEFGVDLGEFLKASFSFKAPDSSRPESSDLEAIRSDLQEKAEVEGAYFCDYDMFKCLYRSQVRLIPRTGLSVFLILFTISGPDGGAPEPEALRAAFDKLKSCILTGLRKGDAVASCSSTQYIAMLQTVTAEAVRGVVQRILRKFKFEYRRDNVKVTTKITSIVDSD